MRTLRRFLRRLTSFASTRAGEARLQSEIEEHIAIQTEENTRAGLLPDEARRQAILDFGPVQSIRETYRDQRGLPSLETLLQDTRHALRRLRLAPAFTLATVLTLALGIGATTSIFTLVQAVLLKSLPVTNPDELFRTGRENACCYFGGYSQEKGFTIVSYDLYTYLRDHTNGFSEMAAIPSVQHQFGVRRAGSPGSAQNYPGEFVSGNYFRMFGLSAYAGRTLLPTDDHPGAPPVAVMSFRLWQQAYSSDPSVIGGIFNLNDKPVTVIGIAPPGFFGDTLRTTSTDFYLPLNSEPYVESDSDLNKYSTHWLNVVGRIRPGVAPASVEAEMRVALKQWLLAHWSEMSNLERLKFPAQTLYLTPGGAGITIMRDHYGHWLQILMAVTGFVLLIVCANVANLMLIRGMERRRQISLSLALGAGALRVIRQAVTESLLLSLFGGLAGLVVAFASTTLILHFAFPSTPGLAGVAIQASPDMSVLLFAFAVSLAAGLIFGIAPAWMSTRIDPIEALRGSGRATVRTGSLPRKALVVLQAALSLVLLSAAGLLTTALRSLEHQNFGFERDYRFIASMNPRIAGYRSTQLPLLYRRVQEAIKRIPAVSSVALCNYSPVTWSNRGADIWVDGQPAQSTGAGHSQFSAFWERATVDYFDVIGDPILRGRGFSLLDTGSAPKVAVINEAFARKFFPDTDPVGKYFGTEETTPREFEVVGVSRDARYFGTGSPSLPIAPMFILPEAQADYSRTNLGSLFLLDILIQAKPGASLSRNDISQAMASVDPNMPLISVDTLSDHLSSLFSEQRLIARLTSFFGILSLVLASIGLYGVTAYNAGRRVTEVGVRMALGANRSDVVRLVLRGASLLILTGLLIGLPLTLAVGRFLGSQLYGINPRDPAVIAIAVLTLGFSALIAALVPALRASSISPSDALRSE